MPPELAVILVTWNVRDLALDALRTLFADLDAHGPQAEVWLVDNASADGTASAVRAQFPQVHVIASARNLGFAAGNNVALREIGFGDPNAPAESLPRAVYFLNPDTRTHPGATRALYDALLTLPRAGVVGAQLEYANGSFQHGAFALPGLWQLFIDLFPVPARLYESRLNGRYPRARYARGEPFPVGHVLGAAMMVRGEVITQTGMFDEGYFMYVEEVDWCARIRRAGWEIYAVPRARVTHLVGQSTGQARPQSVVNLWRSRLRYYERAYSPLKRAIARRMVRWGMARQIARTRRAHAEGRLSADERDALIAAYRSVQQLTRQTP